MMSPARARPGASHALASTISLIASSVAWLACGSDPAPRGDARDASTDGAHADDARAADDASLPPATEPQPLLVPMQEPPSDPGWLEVRPAGLVLGLGETRTLIAQVFQLTGDPVAASGVTWVSSDPAVATIDAAGALTAGRPGVTEIVVTDSGRRSRRLAVAVSPEPPTIPTGFQSERPLVSLETGETTEVEITLTSARGEPTTGAVTIESFGASTVTATLEGTRVRIAATGPGVGRFGFRAGDSSLAGTLLVVVPDRTRPRPASCDGVEPEVEGCWLSSEPYLFTAPGQSTVLRLTAVEQPCGEDFPIVRDVSPSDVVVGDDRVLDLDGAGRLTAVSPGWSAYGVRYRQTACDCPTAGVTPDVNGCWAIDCPSGDTGWMSLGGWAPRVLHGCPTATCAAAHDAFGFFGAPALGTSSLRNEAPVFECSERAVYMPTVGGSGLNCRVQEAPVGGDPRWIAQARLCSEGGCPSQDPLFCGADRQVPEGSPIGTYTTIRGNDRIDFAGCAITRGDACTSSYGRTTFHGVTRMADLLVISHRFPDDVEGTWRVQQIFADDFDFAVVMRGVTAPGVYRGCVGGLRGGMGCGATTVVGAGSVSYQSVLCDPSDSPPIDAGMVEITELDRITRRLAGRYLLYVFEEEEDFDPMHPLCTDYESDAIVVTGEFAGTWRE